MYAVVKTGGKQYQVEEGNILRVELLPNEAGQTFEINEVLMIGGVDDVKVGTPTVEGAKVVFEVVGMVKGPKINGFKYKAKKNYRKHFGHRQKYTVLKVQSIQA